MILVQQEDTLPVAVQIVKKEVLLCLRVMHDLHTYTTRTELVDFLDANLVDLRKLGCHGLMRVALFYRDPLVLMAVQDRMAKGGTLQHFVQPACWPRWKRQLPDLRARAEKISPGFVFREMTKD